MPGTDIPGIVQDPGENYRQGHNHLLEEVHEIIFANLLETVDELDTLKPLSTSHPEGADSSQAAYRTGRVHAAEKVVNPILKRAAEEQ